MVPLPFGANTALTNGLRRGNKEFTSRGLAQPSQATVFVCTNTLSDAQDGTAASLESSFLGTTTFVGEPFLFARFSTFARGEIARARAFKTGCFELVLACLIIKNRCRKQTSN